MSNDNTSITVLTNSRFWFLVVIILFLGIIISYSYKRYEQYRIRREVMNILSYVPLTSGSDDIDDLSNSLFLPLQDINNKNHRNNNDDYFQYT